MWSTFVITAFSPFIQFSQCAIFNDEASRRALANCRFIRLCCKHQAISKIKKNCADSRQSEDRYKFQLLFLSSFNFFFFSFCCSSCENVYNHNIVWKQYVSSGVESLLWTRRGERSSMNYWSPVYRFFALFSYSQQLTFVKVPW